MANPILVEFIKEARKKGIKDSVIKQEMINKGWPSYYIQSAFSFIGKENPIEKEEPSKYEGPQTDFGSSITLFLDDELRTALEKRAKKNMLTLPKLIEDVLRRSTLNFKGKPGVMNEKLDDNLIGLFSRKNTGQAVKKKKAKEKRKAEKKNLKKEMKSKIKALKKKGRR